VQTTLTPDELLSGTMDAEAIARALPKSYVVKGMFFTRLVAELGSAFAQVERTLEAPPRLGRYVPFNDYPQSDYLRVSTAAAARFYPQVSLREAMRRLGRADYSVFASSTIGKIVLSVVGDARSALLKTGYVFMKMAPGDWVVTSEELDACTVRVEFAPVYGTWEYNLGQLEGVVLNYGGEPVTTISELPRRRIRFDVCHTRP
jgi:uncharacterized protein (TIGR02265 family)